MLNCFLVLMGKNRKHQEAVLSAFDQIRGDLLEQTPFVPQRVTVHAHPTQPLVIYSAELEIDGLGSARTHIGENRIVVLDGFPLPDQLPGTLANDRMAETFSTLVDSSNFSDFPRILSGSWSVVDYAEDTGLRVTSDIGDSAPIHWAENSRLIAVGNRASLVARALSSGRDAPVNYSNLAELVSNGNPLDEETRFKGVRTLRPGEVLRYRSQSGLCIRYGRWRPGIPDAAIASLPENERYDAAWSALRSEWKNLVRWNSQRIPCAITGGKDSRCVLGGALGAGVMSRVMAFTWGPGDSPEVETADLLCKRIGAVRGEIPNLSSRYTDTEGLWQRLGFHSWLYEGMVSAWDGMIPPMAQDAVIPQVTGFGGEIHKAFGKNCSNVDFSSDREAHDFFCNWQRPLNRFGLIRQEWIEAMKKNVDTRIGRYREAGIAPHNFGPLAYLETRLVQWARRIGAGRIEQQRFSPLTNPTIVDVGFCQSREDRLNGRLHFELMRRAARELVETPFLKFEWPLYIKSRYPEYDLPGPRKASPGPGGRVTRGAKWRLLEECSGMITGYLLDGRNSSLFDLVERDKLESVLAKETQNRTSAWAGTCYSLVGIKMALDSVYEGSRHQVKGGKTAFCSNIPNLDIDDSFSPSALVYRNDLCHGSLL